MPGFARRPQEAGTKNLDNHNQSLACCLESEENLDQRSGDFTQSSLWCLAGSPHSAEAKWKELGGRRAHVLSRMNPLSQNLRPRVPPSSQKPQAGAGTLGAPRPREDEAQRGQGRQIPGG